MKQAGFFEIPPVLCTGLKMSISNESVQVNRAISTGKLNASPRLHTRPIDVVVYHGSI